MEKSILLVRSSEKGFVGTLGLDYFSAQQLAREAVTQGYPKAPKHSSEDELSWWLSGSSDRPYSRPRPWPYAGVINTREWIRGMGDVPNWLVLFARDSEHFILAPANSKERSIANVTEVIKGRVTHFETEGGVTFQWVDRGGNSVAIAYAVRLVDPTVKTITELSASPVPEMA